MKSSDLLTIHDLVAIQYRIIAIDDDKYLHSFQTKTTGTKYQFESSNEPIIQDGERYSIGYTIDENGHNIVDVFSISKTSSVDPITSYEFSKILAQANMAIEKGKNDTRVTHFRNDGYYWGKKYAWRMFGSILAKQAFYDYLDVIGHPRTPCTTIDPEQPFSNSTSIAYKEEGLEKAIDALVRSCVKSGSAYYKSELFPNRRISIKGITAITYKK